MLALQSRSRLTLFGILVCLLGFGFVACTTQYILPNRPEKDNTHVRRAQNYEQNGFHILIQPDMKQALIRMEVRYTVGASQDPPGKRGLAHLVEHLMFEGPVNDEPGAESVSDALSKVSSYWNAFTTLDSTSYQTTFHPDNLDKVFALEMLRMKRGCLGLGEKTFIRAREVVRNEAREQAHGVGPKLSRALTEFIYDENHPYFGNVIGTDQSIAALTLADACTFIKNNYTPKNTIFVFSGPTTGAGITKLTKTWLRSFSSKHTERIPMPKTIWQTKKRDVARLDIRNPYLFSVWPLEPRGKEEFRLQTQVANGLSYFLGKEAEKHAWATSAQALIMGGAQAPALIAVVQLDRNAGLSDAKELIKKSLDNLLDEEGDYIAQIAGKRRILLQFEDRDYRTTMLADHTQNRSHATEINKLLVELENLSESDVHQSAQRLFSKHQPRYLVIKPGGSSEDGDDKGNFTYSVSSPKQERPLAPSDETVAQAHEVLPLPSRQGEKQNIQRLRLDNGLNLLFWPIDDLPLVHMKLVIPNGSSHSPDEAPGISNLLPGADDYDVTVFSRSLTAENADVAMLLLAAEFETHERIYDKDEFALLRERMKYAESLDRETYSRRLKAAVYGKNHPYTKTNITSKTIARLTPKVVEKWAVQNRTVRGATLIIAGKFDAKLMYEHVVYNFARAPSFKPRGSLFPKTPTQSETAIVSLVQPDRSSLSISLTFRGRRGIGSDMPARDVLTAILNDRLLKLRSQYALTYGMYSKYVPERGLGLWSIAGNVDADRSAEAIYAIVDILKDLRDNPDGYLRSFADARKNRMSGMGAASPTAAQAASRLTQLARYQLEDDYFENYAQMLAHLRPGDIAKLIESEFNIDQAIVGLRGPQAAIDSATKAFRTPRAPVPTRIKTTVEVPLESVKERSETVLQESSEGTQPVSAGETAEESAGQGLPE
ncbi:MAG: insulinase family protein [Kofleriaceae bacterium]|nr:insulinase family protein [Kofleriaceae bacterium]